MSPADGPRSSWFGKKGDVAIGAERLTGLHVWKTRVVVDDTEITDSGTDVALLGKPSGSYGASTSIPRIGSVPRLALDYFVADKISIGGFLGYASLSADHQEGDGKAEELPSTSLLFIGARGGYYLTLGDSLGAWFQGGLSYVSGSLSEGDEDLSLSEVMVNAAASLVIPATRSFGFTAGAFFDGSLTGTVSGQGPDLDAGELGFGATAGLVGWL